MVAPQANIIPAAMPSGSGSNEPAYTMSARMTTERVSDRTNAGQAINIPTNGAFVLSTTSQHRTARGGYRAPLQRRSVAPGSSLPSICGY